MRTARRSMRSASRRLPGSTGWTADSTRWTSLDGRLDTLESDRQSGFTDMRGKLDQTAAGLQLIVTLLTDDGPAAQ